MNAETQALVPVAIVPVYGVIRLTNRPPQDHLLTEHELSLRRDTYQLNSEELLAVLAGAQAQSLLQNWREGASDAQTWVELDRLLREREFDLATLKSERQQRMRVFEKQREAVSACAAAVIAEIDGRAMVGMLRQCERSQEDQIPPSVKTYKWAYEIATKARKERAHGFDPTWDFELSAAVFGDELDLELCYLEAQLRQRAQTQTNTHTAQRPEPQPEHAAA
jgi:hypothetical protein